MGDAAFFFYPEPGAALSTIDLGRRATAIEEWEVRDQEVSRAMSGATSRIVYTAYNRVNVQIDLFGDFNKVVQLETFVNYMRSGGYCSFTEDTAACYAGFATIRPKHGASNVFTHQNLFSDFGDTYAGASGDYIVVQSPSPRMIRETVRISSAAARNFGLANTLRRDFTNESWVLIKDRRFWPWLRLEPGTLNGPIVSPNQHRVTWNIELEFYEPADVVDRLAALPFDPFPTTETATDRDFESTFRFEADKFSGDLVIGGSGGRGIFN
jgi:hypothetical protein